MEYEFSVMNFPDKPTHETFLLFEMLPTHTITYSDEKNGLLFTFITNNFKF